MHRPTLMLMSSCRALPAVVLLLLAAPAAAGVIEGTVRAAANGAPLAGRSVRVTNELGDPVQSAITDGTGRYRVLGLDGGTYYVFVEVSAGYLGQLYPLRDCGPDTCGCGRDGDPIEVGAGQVVSGIDFALVPPATIEGTITDAVTGLPLDGIRLVFRQPDGPGHLEVGLTDQEGRYRLDLLVPGRHWLTTLNFDDYVDEVFDDVPCAGSESAFCQQRVGLGTPIDLEPGQVYTADFALEPGGTISGRTLEVATGEPLQADLWLWTPESIFRLTTSDIDGSFELRGLGAGTYYLAAGPYSNEHRAEIYDGVPCPPVPVVECDPRSGTAIAVSTGETTAVNVELDRLGRISGTVRDGRTGMPVTDGQVRAVAGSLSASGSLMEDGSYTIDGLHGGEYHVIAQAFSTNLVAQLYPGIPCAHGVCDPPAGTAIPVALNGHVEDIDFTLPEGGGIEGTVRRADNGGPPGFQSLLLLVPSGEAIDARPTDDLGRYRFEALATGTYLVMTFSGGELLNEIYDGVHCAGRNCRAELGTPVHVTQGATTGEIDFSLEVGGTVSGRVEDAAGDLTFPLSVNLWSAEGEFMTGSQVQGDYSIGQLPAGSTAPPPRASSATTTSSTTTAPVPRGNVR